MPRPLLIVTLAAAFAGCAFALLRLRAAGGEESGESRFDAAKRRVVPKLKKELAEQELSLGAPVYMRVFKEEKRLEVWVEKERGGRFALFKSYPICTFSGGLGPKLKEGDRQAPEGFYFVDHKRMNPRSQFHLSFDLGFPNTYDRHHGRSGSFLMVHGNCVSTGCFAMTDKWIEEIYTLADAALEGGQSFFRVHCFPFRMTDERMARVADGHRWRTFWDNLKTGHDWFERHRRPPDTTVAAGEYQFSEG